MMHLRAERWTFGRCIPITQGGAMKGLDFRGEIRVFPNGRSAMLLRALVLVAGGMMFIAQAGAGNNTDLIIIGPATTNIAGTLIIGNTGTNNSLQISNAGAVTNGAGIIGNTPPATYNYVIVTNPGSL